MKNSLFLFPQCNILMESDRNAKPYLSGSYEEFATALISLYSHVWCVRLCVLIAALDPKAFIFYQIYMPFIFFCSFICLDRTRFFL